MISQSKLDFYIKHNLNVLLIGRHGTGKTSSVIEAWKRNNLRGAYFSVATMDPWVDFVGIPTECIGEDNKKFIELIPPKRFAYDEIDAIFLDEYNRGNEKVRNATLELIQFRSINGNKLNNLRFVWAAINPDDDISAYDVEKLDMAQKDRFPIWVNVPYAVDRTYFSKKYGDTLANRACDWWNGLSENVKNDVSPRRLDYAIDIYMIGGDLRDVLPVHANVTSLINVLQKDSVKLRLDAAMRNQDTEMAESILKNDTEYTDAISWILEDKERSLFFLPLINTEKYTALISKHKDEPDVLANVVAPFPTSPQLRKIILEAQSNIELCPVINYAIPAAKTDKFGKLAHTVPTFTASKVEYTGFFEKVNDFNYQPHTLEERLGMYDWIKKNVCFTGSKIQGNGIATVMFICKELFKVKNKEELFKNMPDCMSVLNAAFQHIEGGINISTDERFKIIASRLEFLGLDELTWIPTGK